MHSFSLQTPAEYALSGKNFWHIELFGHTDRFFLIAFSFSSFFISFRLVLEHPRPDLKYSRLGHLDVVHVPRSYCLAKGPSHNTGRSFQETSQLLFFAHAKTVNLLPTRVQWVFQRRHFPSQKKARHEVKRKGRENVLCRRKQSLVSRKLTTSTDPSVITMKMVVTITVVTTVLVPSPKSCSLARWSRQRCSRRTRARDY